MSLLNEARLVAVGHFRRSMFSRCLSTATITAAESITHFASHLSNLNASFTFVASSALNPKLGSLISGLKNQDRLTRDKTQELHNLIDKESPGCVYPGSIVRVVSYLTLSKPDLSSSFTGVLIGIKRRGNQTSFRLRSSVLGTGVELQVPIFSPMVKQVQVLKHIKARRNKLYYLRNKEKKDFDEKDLGKLKAQLK
jgi:ribosomal protein L19